MSLKKIEQVKADKGFKIWDLIIYGVIIVIVVTLFIALYTVRDTSPLKGIRVYVVNDVVYEYDFENNKQVSCKTEFVEITENNSEVIILKVNTKNNGYNIIEIKKSGGVKVNSANCGRFDCVYSPEIKDNNTEIHCLPHLLKIVPYDFDIDDGNITI